MGPSSARVTATGRWVEAPLTPSPYPAPASRPVATCLPPPSPPELGSPRLCEPRGPVGPPSTDAGVTPLIGTPPPRGPHQSFTVFCKHPEKPRWTGELACIVLGPSMSRKESLPAALTLAQGNTAPGLNVCPRPPWPFWSQEVQPTTSLNDLAWLLLCDTLGL